MTCKTIVAIGQLPPPVTGFAYITEQMILSMRQAHYVTTCNIAGPVGIGGFRKHIARLLRTTKACLHLIKHARESERVCYIACDGGLGIAYTLLVTITARLAGYKIFMHHHSFAYIDRPRTLMKALLNVGGEINHIFLCETMHQKFAKSYKTILNYSVISNAAFVSSGAMHSVMRPDDALVLGHLSNLTREKGLDLFINLLRASISAGLNVRGILAGPAADAEDRELIRLAVAELGQRLEYRGPAYGEEKTIFYKDIDVFVFPTQYANEAQPTVIFEAQSSGCQIVAYTRGCIANQLRREDLSISPDSPFVDVALSWLRQQAPDIMKSRDSNRAKIQAAYRAIHEGALVQLRQTY